MILVVVYLSKENIFQCKYRGFRHHAVSLWVNTRPTIVSHSLSLNNNFRYTFLDFSKCLILIAWLSFDFLFFSLPYVECGAVTGILTNRISSTQWQLKIKFEFKIWAPILFFLCKYFPLLHSCWALNTNPN